MARSGTRSGWLCLAVCLGLGLAPVAPCATRAEAVPAATSNRETPEYRAAVEAAIKEFHAHSFEESRTLFYRAHTLYPNARTHRGVALAEFELHNYRECVRHLEAALISEVLPLPPEQRTDAELMLARANMFVARVQVDAKPSAARVIVDGVAVDVPEGQALLLNMGDHVLEVQAPGFTTDKRTLSVQGGQQKTLTIILAPEKAAATPPPNKVERAWYKSPWLWSSVGVVVAGAAVGTGVALTREDQTAHPYSGTADAVLKGP